VAAHQGRPSQSSFHHGGPHGAAHSVGRGLGAIERTKKRRESSIKERKVSQWRLEPDGGAEALDVPRSPDPLSMRPRCILEHGGVPKRLAGAARVTLLFRHQSAWCALTCRC